LDILGKVSGTVRIEIVGKNRAAFLGCRNSKWAYTGKYICDNVVRVEELHESIVFSMQAGVPVHLSEVESEATIRLVLERR
jgi:hypothetical protein